MAADQNLIKAAFKESLSTAQTKVPDLAKFYEATAKQSESYMKILTDAFTKYQEKETVRRIGREKQLSTFKGTLNQHYTELLSGSSMPEKVILAVDNEVKRLQEEFEAVNTFGKNDTQENERARMRINAQLVKIINEAKNATTTFGKINTNMQSLLIGDLDESVIAAQNKMMHKDIDQDNDVTVSFVNGKLTYTAKNYLTRPATQEDVDNGLALQVDDQIKTGNEISYNLSQMESNFPAVDTGAQTAIYNAVNTYTDQARRTGEAKLPEDFDPQEATNAISQIITAENFNSLSLVRNGDLDENSFATRLKNNELIDVNLSVMDAIFQQKFITLEKDGQPGITEADFNMVTEEEQEGYEILYNEMVKQLSDSNHPEFSLERSKPLLTEYYKTITENRYFIQYDKSAEVSNMITLYGKPMPKPRTGTEREIVGTIQSIMGEYNRVKVMGDFYQWDPNTKTYNILKKVGAGYMLYTEEEKQSMGKSSFTKRELIEDNYSNIVYGRPPVDYDFDAPGSESTGTDRSLEQ